MDKAYVQKHVVLQEFTRLLHRCNPMQLNLDTNPHAEDEYEAEALSILSRFTEAALNLCADKETQREIAVNLVKNAFAFWFHDVPVAGLEETAGALLATFVASYPTLEQEDPVEVPSEA